jgi:hypothetical protein
MRFAVKCALLVVGPVLASRAQAQTSPNGGTIAGVVVDTAGQPLRDVEVVIPDADVRTRTNSTGAFELLGVKPGRYEVWFRRLGLIVVQYPWESRIGARLEVRVKMRPLPNTLDPVVVYASEERSMKARSMVSGTVTDSAGVPLDGVQVQLAGTGRTTVTSDDGSFVFRHVAPGDMVVRARLLGFAPASHAFTLLDTDDRKVYLRLKPLAQELDEVVVTAESGFGPMQGAWKDYDSRMRWKTTSGSAMILGPERLQSLGGIPLDLALRGAPQGFSRKTVGANSRAKDSRFMITGDVCILENGLRAVSRPLRSYAASDLEMIEYYPNPPPETELTGTVAERMSAIRGCGGVIGSHPPYYVLWFKDAK